MIIGTCDEIAGRIGIERIARHDDAVHHGTGVRLRGDDLLEWNRLQLRQLTFGNAEFGQECFRRCAAPSRDGRCAGSSPTAGPRDETVPWPRASP